MNEEPARRYLLYILESIDLIEAWTSAGRDAYLTDELVQNATPYRLETLAEAAGKLPIDLRDRHPGTPWRSVIDFRNRVSHGYLTLDLDLVWRVIEIDLPGLKQIVEEEMDRLSSP